MLKESNPERLRRLGRELGWVVAGNAAVVVGSLVIVRVLTELLSPAAYGQLALVMTLATLVNQTVMAPLSNAATRFYAPAVENNGFAAYISVLRRSLVQLSLAVAAVSAVFAALLMAMGLSIWLGLVAAAALYALGSGWNAIASGVQSAARQRSVVALHSGAEPWLRLALSVAFIQLIGPTSTSAMMGAAASLGCVLVSQAIFLRGVRQRSSQAITGADEWTSKFREYALPFAIWGSFAWLQQASDRWALGMFGSTEQVGLYAALFQIGYYPVGLVTGLMMQFLGPIFFQQAGDATDPERNMRVTKLSRKFAAIVLMLTSVAFGLGMVSHEWIFGILVAEEYTSVSGLLPWMLLAGGLFAAGQTVTLNLMSQLQAKKMLTAKIATAVLGVALNFAGAYLAGIRGVVVASIVFALAHLVWVAALSRTASAR